MARLRLARAESDSCGEAALFSAAANEAERQHQRGLALAAADRHRERGDHHGVRPRGGLGQLRVVLDAEQLGLDRR